MNQRIYNETYQACMDGGMISDAAHEYATDLATRNVAKAPAKTGAELSAAGYTMAGSTTDDTARRDIEKDYAASGFDVAWTQLINGTWNYYTRKHEPAGAVDSYAFTECLLGALQDIAGTRLSGHAENPVYSAFSLSNDSERQINVALSNGQSFRLTVEVIR